jgi:hypothetical protein
MYIPPYQQATPIPVATQVATPIPVATQVATPMPVATQVATPMPETTQELPSPPQPPLPYSNIDDQTTTIQRITEGDEYKNLVSYIQKTKTRIDDKGGKLKTKVDNFIKNHLLTLEAKDNHMIRDDFLKQYSSLVFKLEDIIKNIQNINHGIQDEGNADAKINVDLMTNQWYLFSLRNKRFFTTGWLYRWFKKPFSKDAHVINADELTKEHYNTFREKLYNLYVKLHKDFPQSEGKKYETAISELVFTKIRVKLEEFYKKELKAKAEAAEANEEKERAYKEANEAEDATPKETTNDTSTATSTQPPQPSTATQQPPQSSEEDITTMALLKVKEGKEARAKATADALGAKEKLMKIDEEAKANMEALAKQKAELEKQARASVLNSREAIAEATEKGIKGSTNFTALLGKAPQITEAKNSFDNLGKDLGKQFGLLKPKIPPNLTQQFATV